MTDKPIKWFISEYYGCEIWRAPEGTPWPPSSFEECEQIAVKANQVYDELKSGDEFLGKTLFGYVTFTVQLDAMGEPLGLPSKGNHIYTLARDERGWVLTGSINTRGLKRLSIRGDQ